MRRYLTWLTLFIMLVASAGVSFATGTRDDGVILGPATEYDFRDGLAVTDRGSLKEIAVTTLTAADIDGGAIDGAPIGANSASTGKFTTLENTGARVMSYEQITATSAGVAASLTAQVTQVTTNGDSDNDDVTLADGTIDGQVKQVALIAEGNASDTWAVTPANFTQGATVNWGNTNALGEGATFQWDNGAGAWDLIDLNGGTVN